MIGKKIVWFAFIFSIITISLSIIFRIKEEYTLSNILFASSLIIFLIFSWIQRKIKEDMLHSYQKNIKRENGDIIFPH